MGPGLDALIDVPQMQVSSLTVVSAERQLRLRIEEVHPRRIHEQAHVLAGALAVSRASKPSGRMPTTRSRPA